VDNAFPLRNESIQLSLVLFFSFIKVVISLVFSNFFCISHFHSLDTFPYVSFVHLHHLVMLFYSLCICKIYILMFNVSIHSVSVVIEVLMLTSDVSMFVCKLQQQLSVDMTDEPLPSPPTDILPPPEPEPIYQRPNKSSMRSDTSAQV
jgi:hypothetical protein